MLQCNLLALLFVLKLVKNPCLLHQKYYRNQRLLISFGSGKLRINKAILLIHFTSCLSQETVK